MHYRVSLINPGSGQFRSACGQTVQDTESTIYLSAVDCEACRTTERFKHNDRVLPPAAKEKPQE